MVVILSTMVSAIIAAEGDSGRADPTAQEQYFLYLINRARANPLAEARRLGINLNEGLSPGTISDAPRQPLVFHPKLTQAARRHTQWMLTQNTLSHEGAGDSTPEQRMRSAGYTFTPPCGSGENLGFVGQTGDYAPAAEAIDDLYRGLFLDADVADRGHRVNLLRAEFRETGVGVQKGTFRSQGTDFNSWLVTQDFAYNLGNPCLTGVVYSDIVKADGFYTPGEGLGGVTITAQVTGGSAKFSAATGASGGYVLQLPPGAYRVMAAGGGLPKMMDGGTVAIGKDNVGVDFRLGGP